MREHQAQGMDEHLRGRGLWYETHRAAFDRCAHHARIVVAGQHHQRRGGSGLAQCIERVQAVEKSLGALGMAVTAFNNAEDTLASPEVADADFYISDLRLPGRLDGVQLLNAIQQRSARPIRAVLLTGDASPNQIDSSAASNWTVLFKPVDLSKLLSMMTETTGHLRRPESRKHQP